MTRLGHRPVLAVLSFTTDEVGEAALLAQGFVEDLTGELARFSGLDVIAPRSGAAVADMPDRQAAERLGATHILRGRFQRDGDRLRITAHLVDGASGTQLVGEKLESAVSGFFDMQDELIARIAATLSARIDDATLKQSRRKPAATLAAYELTLRGLTLLRQGSAQADAEARDLFEQALERDPLYARAHAGLSLSWFNEWSCAFWDRFEENGRLAYQSAHQALDLDDNDAMPHLVLGRLLLYHREFERASWYLDRALMLCPNDSDLLIQLSSCEVFLGRPEVGRLHAEKALRLNPYHPNDYYAYAALPHFMLGDFRGALAIGGKSVGSPIVDIPAYAAIAHARLGEWDEARRHYAYFDAAFRQIVTKGRDPEPGEGRDWLLRYNPYRRQQDIDFVSEGFQLLGDDAAGRAPRPAAPATGSRKVNDAPVHRFQRHGDRWRIVFSGREALLPDMKGLHDILRLLERPGEEIHCLDLTERSDDAYAGDAVLDDKARQALKLRVRDLQEELVEAEDMNDIGRAARIRNEMDQLLETLSRALGLGGRERRLGSFAERARTTVAWRIRHAIRKIEPAHEALARHLRNSIRTGVFCSYRPEQPLSWRFDVN